MRGKHCYKIYLKNFKRNVLQWGNKISPQCRWKWIKSRVLKSTSQSLAMEAQQWTAILLLLLGSLGGAVAQGIFFLLTRVSFETSFDSKQPKLELKLVSALSETKRLFRFFTKTECFGVLLEQKSNRNSFIESIFSYFFQKIHGCFGLFWYVLKQFVSVISLLYLYSTLPHPATHPSKTYSMAVRAIPLPVFHQGPLNGYRTGFKKCSDAQQIYSANSCRWHKCKSGWSLKTEKIHCQWHVYIDTTHTIRHLFLTWTSFIPSYIS
jgi:hypothetical protein